MRHGSLLWPLLLERGTQDRERLADQCDQLYLSLADHLDAEQQRLLPIAAWAITQAD